MEKYCYLIVAAIYAVVAIDFWRAPKHNAKNWHTLAVGFGLIFHAWLLKITLFYYSINLSLSNAISAILWLTILIYWLASFKNKLQSLQAFALPIAAICVLYQGFFRHAHFIDYANQPYFFAHIVVALLAYSLFTFATFHAALMSLAERSLHQKTSMMTLPDFPPLLPMEKLLFQVISLAFVLLSLTLLSGLLFSEEIYQQAFKFNHKNVFAVLSWLVYGTLLYGHFKLGWRGRKAIHWTIAGFGLLLLAYVGSKFVFEVMLTH